MRAPQATAPERIAALATLPVFFKLQGRRALLAGSSDGALWKAELLVAAGADLDLCVPGDAEPFAALAARLEDRRAEGFGKIVIHRRNWAPHDIDGAALAVGDFSDEGEGRAFAQAARSSGVPVNVIDKPGLCDFQFGSIVNRSPLLVAISTDGAAPVFGQAIRARIEAILPRGLARWAGAARDWRPSVQARNLSYAARRRFWEVFTARALREPGRAPQEADRLACHVAVDAGESTPRGRIVLVGAGPGDPALLTMKAAQAMQAADVILYDDLVSAGVLDVARREAERIAVGKTGHGASCAQTDINALMVELALAGKSVVRLKGGDPLVFGRATEELEAAHQAGFEIEIVPGITAAQAAAASLGVSLTERRTARRVQFVTGHDVDGDLPSDLDWRAIADPNVSTAVYMPRKSLARLAETLTRHNLPATTPAVAIASVSREDQAHVAGTLAELAKDTAALPAGPLLILIGEAFRRSGGTAQPARAVPGCH